MLAPRPTMIPVRLETADGRFVATVEMLPFQKFPELLCWGQRFFYWMGLVTAQHEVTYREGLLYVVPPAMDTAPTW